MRKSSSLFSSFCFIVILSTIAALTANSVNGQEKFDNKKAVSLIQQNLKLAGLSDLGTENIKVTNFYYDRTLDADLVYVQEMYKGIPVYNSIKSIAFKKEKLASVTGSKFFEPTLSRAPKSSAPSILPLEAINAVAKNLSLPVPQSRAALKTTSDNHLVEYDGMGISQDNIKTELMWTRSEEGDLTLTWQVNIQPINSSDYLIMQVDANNSKIINKINLTVFDHWGESPKIESEGGMLDENHKRPFNLLAPPPPSINSATYRVLPFPIESPLHGTFSLVNDPWLLAGAGNNATTLGWHNDGTTEYNSTRGNNVWSKEDRAGDNETTIGVSTTSSTAAPNYTFTDIFDPATSPIGTVNQKAAITNLFYWNNIIHDITYQYGFDEVSGNFQNDNLGRGGTGADYVLGDAQDGSGSNNANFATPSDGSRPRMQMFLFSPSPDKILKINSPAGSAGFVQAYEVIVSANNKLNDVGPVTADVVLYDNSTNLGCTAAAANAFAGKIVLIARGGTCNAQPKIKNAQNGGAVGVLLYQADASAAGYLTTTTDNTVTIPAVLMTLANAQAIITAMSAGTVNVTLSGINIDGDFDNGVIVHEYGHGISNRLTGGPSLATCLQNKEQMGEGWSDYYALMLTTNWATASSSDGPNKRPIGNYAFGQNTTGGGIRRYPYTTNMTINPWTYGMLATGTSNQGVPGQVHLVGEIWAATLWDMTWNIIGIDGINTNLYDAAGVGGNTAALKLVTQGMKLQPCSPGFLDGRNAILKADTLLYNGKYSCAIWQAFARRGMGVNAIQGSSNSVTDQTENFTLPTIPNRDTTAVACDSLVWRGDTYFTSGDYTKAITIPGGCNTNITLRLTIKNSSATSETLSVCDSTYWNGTKYYASGVYKYTTPNAVGCDSVVTLNLTVKKSTGISSVTADNNPLCVGQLANLSAIDVAGTNAVVTWFTEANGGGTNLGTGTSLPNVGPGTYYARVTADCGSPVEASIVVTQYTALPIITCRGDSTLPTLTTSCTRSIGFVNNTSFANNCSVTTLTWALTGATVIKSALAGINQLPVRTYNRGVTTVTLTVKNASGNSASCSYNVTVVDNVLPVFTFRNTATIRANIVSGCSANVQIPDVTFSDNCGTPTLSWSMTGATTQSNTGQVGTKAFNRGTTLVTYTLTDIAGNFRTSSFNVVVRDSIIPVITCPGDTVVTTTAVSCQKGFTVARVPVYNDNCGVTSLTWRMTGATTAQSGGTGINVLPFRTYNKGTTAVTYTAKDATGNESTCSFNVNVIGSGACAPTVTLSRTREAVNINNELKAILTPNPTSSLFALRVKSNSKAAVEVTVYNSEGKRIQQLKTANLNNILFGEKYTSGSYLIEVRQGENRTTIVGVKQ